MVIAKSNDWVSAGSNWVCVSSLFNSSQSSLIFLYNRHTADVFLFILYHYLGQLLMS